MAIRQINLNNHIEELGELLKSYIREDMEDPSDGMFYNVITCTKTINGVEYTGRRATAQIGSGQVPVVDFYVLTDNTLYVEAYYNGLNPSSQVRQFKWSSSNQYNKLAYAYCTDNGILLNYQYTSDSPPTWGTVMITKGSDGYPFVVMGNYTNNNYTIPNYHANVLITHVTDPNYTTPGLMGLTTAQDQTAMCPFMGYGDQVSVTYTPYAYWIQQAPTSVRNTGYSVMKFNKEIDGISNGYWAIFDGTGEEASG